MYIWPKHKRLVLQFRQGFSTIVPKRCLVLIIIIYLYVRYLRRPTRNLVYLKSDLISEIRDRNLSMLLKNVCYRTHLTRNRVFRFFFCCV